MTAGTWVQLPVPNPPLKMTYPEFLEWADEDVHAEWVDGRVEYTHLRIDPETLEITMSVSKAHTVLGAFLITLLRMWLETSRLGQIFYAPYQMKTGPGLPGREPDVMFVSEANLCRSREKYLEGPADVALEIVSEESSTRDRIWKLAEYETGGVKEYWIIDSLEREVLLYHVQGDGRYARVQADPSGRLHSVEMTGVWFDPAWFSQETLPAVTSVLQQWGLI